MIGGKPQFDFSPAAGISAGGPVLRDGEKLAGAWPVAASWNYRTNRATLRFGLRYDRWRTVAAVTPGNPPRLQTWTRSGEPKWISNFNHISDDGTNTFVTAVLNKDTKKWRMRLLAVDKDGHEHSFSQGNISPVGDAATWTCTFTNLTENQIKEIRVQAKPIHWIEFRNLLLPGSSRTLPHSEPVLDSPPKFNARALAAKPELRFIAWQDQWKSNGVASARHRDGTPVMGRAELDILRHEQPTTYYMNAESRTNASFLHFWFSHPAFDRQSLVAVSLADENGRPLTLGAQGRMASRVHQADALSPDLGWITATLCPSDGPLPGRVTVRLDYVAGPLEKVRSVAPDFHGAMTLEGESELSAIGSNSSGNAFVTLTVDSSRLGRRTFGVVAVTRDGREVAQAGGMRNTSPARGTASESFEFDLPLSQVKQFNIGTRPVRTATWNAVLLPPLVP